MLIEIKKKNARRTKKNAEEPRRTKKNARRTKKNARRTQFDRNYFHSKHNKNDPKITLYNQ